MLLSIGLTTEDLALVSKSKPQELDGEDNVYSIEYKGFIAPLVKVVQGLIQKVNDMERKYSNFHQRFIFYRGNLVFQYY